MGASFAREVEGLPDERFRHEALLYAGDGQFVDACSTFIRAGLEADEPTLVVALAPKLEQLREALGADAEGVQFADMDAVGRNPANHPRLAGVRRRERGARRTAARNRRTDLSGPRPA